jgi:uncharacterized membrane protein
MVELLQENEARTIILLAVLVMLCAVGFYVIGRVRGTIRKSDQISNDLFMNFRELHSRGKLTDEEYRTIKAKLATRLQEELKEKEQKG